MKGGLREREASRGGSRVSPRPRIARRRLGRTRQCALKHGPRHPGRRGIRRIALSGTRKRLNCGDLAFRMSRCQDHLGVTPSLLELVVRGRRGTAVALGRGPHAPRRIKCSIGPPSFSSSRYSRAPSDFSESRPPPSAWRRFSSSSSWYSPSSPFSSAGARRCERPGAPRRIRVELNVRTALLVVGTIGAVWLPFASSRFSSSSWSR